MKRSKSYCTMEKKSECQRAFKEFDFLPDTFLENRLWVCSGCLKPSYMIWEQLIKHCDDCLSEAVLPWEDLCSPCFYRLNEKGVRYSGLSAALSVAAVWTPSELWSARRDNVDEVVASWLKSHGYETWWSLLKKLELDQRNLLTP